MLFNDGEYVFECCSYCRTVYLCDDQMRSVPSCLPTVGMCYIYQPATQDYITPLVRTGVNTSHCEKGLTSGASVSTLFVLGQHHAIL